MKNLLLLSGIAILFISCNQSKQEIPSNVEAGTPKKVKIIFDTDMGPDYDDVGAIAVLHALADKGECEILATLSSNRYNYSAATIEAFNTYFNKPEIPIGLPVDKGPQMIYRNNWNDSIVTKYLHNKTDLTYPSAVEVYRKVLAAQPDKSVTIVTVGFFTNLAELLQSQPDEYSNLVGRELIKTKVKELVSMAGKFPEGYEFNVEKDSTAAHYAINNWPTPVLFSGFEIGFSILTGNKVAQTADATNPVAWAYRYNLETYGKNPAKNRQSWDQTAVLCAVRNPEQYFYILGPGKLNVEESGYNAWDAETDADHYFLVHKYPYGQIANLLDELMMHTPVNQ
ncbi:MAG: nucleoside hydrolase [Bacteroidota bacterium]